MNYYHFDIILPILINLRNREHFYKKLNEQGLYTKLKIKIKGMTEFRKMN